MKLPAAMAQSGSLSVARQACPIVRRWFVARPAFTLVEVLIATAITLLLMAGIVTLFASVSESVSRGQAMMETGDRLRGAQHRLQTDLKYVTAPLLPSLDPRDGLGYFEIVEGPGPYLITGVGPGAVGPLTRPINSENGGTDDTTVGDVDDFFMFTARSYGEPFVGRGGSSQVAEICWFMRGTTLYRRVLLVLPELVLPMSSSNTSQPLAAMYNQYDLSVHQEGGNSDPNANWGELRLIPNSLGDLTKRENRYAHWPRYAGGMYPHDVRMWGAMGLPTLQECSHANWPFPAYGLLGNTPPLPPGPPYNRAVPEMDYWLPQPFAAPHAWNGMVDPETGADNNYLGPRITEDVALTNVLSFDVKVWDPYAPVLQDGSNPPQILEPGDPGYRTVLQSAASAIQNWVNNGRPTNNIPTQVVRLGAYVDLYYARGIASPTNTISSFSHAGNPRSQLQAAANGAAIWDTFPTHYEHDGVDQDGDGIVDNAADGLDNNNMGGVDDASERETAPPYDAPIRSIQIKIRVFERDSRQIREVTVTQDFVP